MVVKSPKSGVSFWSYGDYEQQFEAARQRALPVLRALLEDDSNGSSSTGGQQSRGSAGTANGAVPSPRLVSMGGSNSSNGAGLTAASS